MRSSAASEPAARWFTQVDPADRATIPVSRSHGLVRCASLAAGAPSVPRARAARRPRARGAGGRRDPLRLGLRGSGRGRAPRSLRRALDAGIDLAARAYLSGEPVTDAKLRRSGGAARRPRPGTARSRPAAGLGMPGAGTSDDMHVFHDLHAIVQPEDSPSLFVTSLRRAAPLVMLNLSMGDQAALRPRACGCPLERLGWTTHLHGVLSREKLTAGGMTFYDVDVVRVLEHVLPRRFGGGPDGLPARRGRGRIRRARRAPSGPPGGRAPGACSRRRDIPGRDRQRVRSRAHHGHRVARRQAPPGASGARRWQALPGRSCTSTSPVAAGAGG